jgi:hypothetical protein
LRGSCYSVDEKIFVTADRAGLSIDGMAKTEKIAIALPSDQVEAVERAVAEGRASTVHAYFSAAIDAVERDHAARMREKGAAAGAKKSARPSSAPRSN